MKWNSYTYVLYYTKRQPLPSPRATFLHHGRRVTSICKASPNAFTYVHIPVNTNMQHCNTSVASHRAIWQHCWIAVYISLGLKIITGVQALANTIRWSQKGSTPFGNLHCSVPWHCSRSPTESELLLPGLSAMLSKVECCPTAHEVRWTQWNLISLTYRQC